MQAKTRLPLTWTHSKLRPLTEGQVSDAKGVSSSLIGKRKMGVQRIKELEGRVAELESGLNV